MAICELPENHGGTGCDAGLFLKTVRGAARDMLVCALLPLYDGEPVEYTYEATPSELVISHEYGAVRICFASDGIILFKGEGENTGLRFMEVPETSGFKYIHEVRYEGKTHHMVNVPKSRSRYLAHAIEGEIAVEQNWAIKSSGFCVMDYLAANGGFLCVLEEVFPEWGQKKYAFDYIERVNTVKSDFEAFYNSMPETPAEYEEARKLAAYINWSAYVRKSGEFKRDGMLMSKNWMPGVWSWDHCFNAIALSYNNPGLAWDQFMLVFDLQDKSGSVPDCINDAYSTSNFCKPPIHGWTLFKLAERMELSAEQCAEAYDRLGRHTSWWLKYRDGDGDGICEYWHGNDSGWDNSTAFSVIPPLELPDLAAYLVIQMDALAWLAEKLNLPDGAAEWKRKADKMLENMANHCYKDGVPLALQSGTHIESGNDSLLMYMPVVLGKRLPEHILKHTLDVLKSGRFLTEHGYATESPQSKHYRPNGYWQGPIWAPSTMLIVDGLIESGEKGLAGEVARKFCEMVKKSGCAENYDALAGEGLCDRAYTWTASVFLILANFLNSIPAF